MSDCCFGVSPVNYPDPDPEQSTYMPLLAPADLVLATVDSGLATVDSVLVTVGSFVSQINVANLQVK